MNWEALGANGEIIGAAAVLATLFYLAAQIKTQNRQLEKSNENVTAQLSIDINNMLINNSDVLMRDNKFARIYQKVASNFVLDNADAQHKTDIEKLGYTCLATDTVIPSQKKAATLCSTILSTFFPEALKT